MSDATRIHRRSLFDAFRRALGSAEPREAAPSPGLFSLSAFYERREAAASEAFPHVTCRPGIATVETTSIGAGPASAPPTGGPPRGRVA